MIVFSKILSDQKQRHNRRHCQVIHIDHLGNQYYDNFSVQGEANLEDILKVKAITIYDNVVRQEIAKVVSVIEEGKNMLPLNYTTIKDVQVALIERQTLLIAEINALMDRKDRITVEIDK